MSQKIIVTGKNRQDADRLVSLIVSTRVAKYKEIRRTVAILDEEFTKLKIGLKRLETKESELTERKTTLSSDPETAKSSELKDLKAELKQLKLMIATEKTIVNNAEEKLQLAIKNRDKKLKSIKYRLFRTTSPTFQRKVRNCYHYIY